MINENVNVSYDLESLTHYRADGTYVGTVNGMPYHVIPGDRLWEKAIAIATTMGDDLPLEPAYVPLKIPVLFLTARQLRLGLLSNGVSGSAVTTKINSIVDPVLRETMLVEWEYSTQYKIDNILIEFIKTSFESQIGLIDDFWNQASQI